ncbi:MAG: hypothetical protein LPK80_10595 [Bacteroidota bacterium]|nr:hypothetical protein [Bacteroidota bacterium]
MEAFPFRFSETLKNKAETRKRNEKKPVTKKIAVKEFSQFFRSLNKKETIPIVRVTMAIVTILPNNPLDEKWERIAPMIPISRIRPNMRLGRLGPEPIRPTAGFDHIKRKTARIPMIDPIRNQGSFDLHTNHLKARPDEANNNPAIEKSRRSQFTEDVNCMAISGMERANPVKIKTQ